MDFDGKTAIVTGAARGIGRGIALELARRGSNVVIADIDEESAREAVAEDLTSQGMNISSDRVLLTASRFRHSYVSVAAIKKPEKTRV